MDVTDQELTQWEADAYLQLGFHWEVQVRRLIAQVRLLQERAEHAEAEGDEALTEGATLGHMMAAENYQSRIRDLEAERARLVSAMQSVEADLILVEASFNDDPLRAIDAPAWLDNALLTIRAALSHEDAP